MTAYYLVVYGSITLAGASAVAGLVWAWSTGHFSRFEHQATSIFDPEEMGRRDDGFPSSKRAGAKGVIG